MTLQLNFPLNEENLVFFFVSEKWLLFWFLTGVVKFLFSVTVVRTLVLFQAFIVVAATGGVAFTAWGCDF